MSNTIGGGTPVHDRNPTAQPATGLIATTFAERESGDTLLRFLSRLSAFGLAAGSEPLLKPAAKPAR